MNDEWSCYRACWSTRVPEKPNKVKGLTCPQATILITSISGHLGNDLPSTVFRTTIKFHLQKSDEDKLA